MYPRFRTYPTHLVPSRRFPPTIDSTPPPGNHRDGSEYLYKQFFLFVFWKDDVDPHGWRLWESTCRCQLFIGWLCNGRSLGSRPRYMVLSLSSGTQPEIET